MPVTSENLASAGDDKSAGGARLSPAMLMLAAGAAALAVALGMMLWRRPHFGPDFLVFWSAAQQPVRDIYQFSVVPGRPLPLVYPPTFLMLLQAFAGVSARSAYLVWVGLSTFAFVAAGATLLKRLAPLVLLAPPVVFAAVTGETSLLLGAGVLAGLAGLPRRPLVAGALFGLVLSLKPQIAFLLPVGLVAARQWKALAATATAGAGMMALSALTLGAQSWMAWVNVLPAFTAFERQVGLQTVALAPHAGLALRALLATAGAGVVWSAFRTPDLAMRLIACVGASLLAAPHAMAYDTSMIAPAALALALRRQWARLPAAAFCLGMVGNGPALAAVVALCGTPILAAVDRRAPFPSLRWPSAPQNAGDSI